MSSTTTTRLRIALAADSDRDAIYRLRHDVYASELRQHAENAERRLSDALDAFNIYIAAFDGDELVGFVSITPPGQGRYSIDKYLAREELPFKCDDMLYEVRLLTVAAPHRGRPLAGLLMYAAVRWILAQGGERIVAIGRREILDLYRKVGLQLLGKSIHSGAVTFELMTGSARAIERDGLVRYTRALHRLEDSIDWQLGMPLVPAEQECTLDPCNGRAHSATCYHGGAFWDAIGDEFDSLDRARTIVPADVLDAWFPPAPGVMAAMRERLPFLLSTSPPTGCEGLIRVIARSRHVDPASILPGPGSSALIFQAFQHWLTAQSRVLILDPTYGEYAHVLDRVVGCKVDQLKLDRTNNYRFDPNLLAAKLGAGTARHSVIGSTRCQCDSTHQATCTQDGEYDLVVLVNPNSPTGQHVDRAELESALRRVPERTRVWIDETYIEYASADESLERFASESSNVVICKSMSKVYALSGARVAYLCGPPAVIDSLRTTTPPWTVSLPAQVAAIAALTDPAYYAARYAQTHRLRAELIEMLRTGMELPLEIVPGVANFVLCHLPPSGPDAATICSRCRSDGVFVRDARSMSDRLGTHTIRITVRDSIANQRVADTLARALKGTEDVCH